MQWKHAPLFARLGDLTDFIMQIQECWAEPGPQREEDAWNRTGMFTSCPEEEKNPPGMKEK